MNISFKYFEENCRVPWIFFFRRKVSSFSLTTWSVLELHHSSSCSTVLTVPLFMNVHWVLQHQGCVLGREHNSHALTLALVTVSLELLKFPELGGAVTPSFVLFTSVSKKERVIFLHLLFLQYQIQCCLLLVWPWAMNSVFFFQGRRGVQECLSLFRLCNKIL